jgi:hypothetical protein
MASDEEVRRRLNEEKIRQDRERREADEASKARIREQIEEQRRKGK